MGTDLRDSSLTPRFLLVFFDTARGTMRHGRDSLDGGQEADLPRTSTSFWMFSGSLTRVPGSHPVISQRHQYQVAHTVPSRRSCHVALEWQTLKGCCIS